MAPVAKGSIPLFQQLAKALDSEGDELVKKVKGLVHFKIDGSEWALDLRPGSNGGKGSLKEGPPDDKADIVLTVSDDNFVKMVAGKQSPQQMFLMRRLKIQGSMGMAMKLQPILDAAKPQAKL